MDVFLYACNAVVPVVLLIVLGYGLRQAGVVDEPFLRTANRFVFRVALPVLLFCNIYTAPGLESLDWVSIGYSLCVIFALFFLGMLLARWLIPDPRQKGVIVQCVLRSNFAIVGIPVVQALADGRQEAVVLAAVLSAFAIPAFNVLGVVSLSMYHPEGGYIDWRGIGRSIGRNPLIRGVLLGILALVLRQVLPHNADGTPVVSLSGTVPFLWSALEMLAQIASPLALIVLGGLFELRATRTLARQIVVGTLGRIVLAPLLGIGMALWLTQMGLLSFGPNEYPALVPLFGTPVAVSSAIMAAQMDGDEQLAGQLVVWTSIGSVFTLFAAAALLRAAGCL